MATKGKSKGDRLRALAFAAEMWGPNAEAWTDSEGRCEVGVLRNVGGGVVFRVVKAHGATWAEVIENVHRDVRRSSVTYWPRNDWALALIDCAIAGTLDRENAAQFMAWAEAQSWEAARGV